MPNTDSRRSRVSPMSKRYSLLKRLVMSSHRFVVGYHRHSFSRDVAGIDGSMILISIGGECSVVVLM